MRLWATPKLADEIVAGTVSDRDKLAYYVFSAVFYVGIGYLAGYTSSFHVSWLYIYEAVVVGAVTFAGAYRVTSSYQRPIDGAFFEMSFLLAVPLMVKTTLATWVAVWGGSWLMSAMLQQFTPQSAESARALSYWAERFWQLLPLIVAVVIAVVFWYRLAHYVAYVASKRGA